MKRKLWRIISCVLTLCLLAVSLNFLTNLMERKASLIMYQPFFEQEADFDVLFIGSSHVKNGVFPMELWNDYGIVSYNYGGDGNRIPTTYWVMENALDYTTPKLIVVDCYFLEEDTKTTPFYSNLHSSLDAFPLSATKIKATLDLLNDPVLSKRIEDGTVVEAEKRTPVGLLWDFSIYHTRWNVLKEDDFQVITTSEKGALPIIAVAVPQDFLKVGRSEKLEENTVGIEYLKKLIEKCQKRGIDILLTYLPFPANVACQKSANIVYEIAAEYGINYINFLDMDIVDFNTDCSDSNNHLNPSGARKVTDYLGKYIMENYQIPDQRGNPEYSDWFEDYEEYKETKRSNLQAQRSWDTYLMLLADKNLDAVVEIKNSDIWNDNRFVNLVENLGINMSSVSGTTNYLMIRRGGLQAEAVSLDMTGDTQTDTMMGLLQILYNDSGEYSVYLNDAACFLPGGNNNGNIRIYVRDSENLNTVGQAAF